MNTLMDEAVEIIKKGGLVAFPTDTVYCLGADPFNDAAVGKIYEVKKRPRDMALPVIVADMQQLRQICTVTPLAEFLADEFFPVGFTLVLPKLPRLSGIVTAGKSSVAVRIQDHPLASAIVRMLGHGVIGTSANMHNLPSPITGEEVRLQIGDKIDLIIDGRCTGGVESTIVDVTGDKPLILRQGAVASDRVEAAWQRYLKMT
jgi:L-threonylcarbamoyladenylate synthase